MLVWVVSVLCAGAPPDAWLGRSLQRSDLSISGGARDVPLGYALRVDATAGNATVAQWRDGGWVPLPIAPDTDPSVPGLWFALPQKIPAGVSDDSLALFTGDPAVASPANPVAVFLKFEDFNTCDLGARWNVEGVESMAFDSGFTHRDGGCSLRLDATVQGYTSIHSFERYTTVAVDSWWSFGALIDGGVGDDINTGNGVLEQYPDRSGFGFGWVKGFGGWISGELLHGDYTAGQLISAPDAGMRWRRVVNAVDIGGLVECLDGVCAPDARLTNPFLVFDAGSVSLGRRVNNTYDAGENVWVDDLIVRPFMWPEPVVADAGQYLGLGAACSEVGARCASHLCRNSVCEVSPIYTLDGGTDGGLDPRRALTVGCSSSGATPLVWVLGLAVLLRRRAKKSG